MFRRDRGDMETLKSLKAAGAVISTELADGRWLGVSVADLIVLGPEGENVRRPWTEVESAAWNGDARRLTVRWVDSAEPLLLTTATDKVFDVVTAVRERVTASQAHVEIMPTAAGDLRVFIRRRPDGSMFSQLVARGPLTDEEMAEAEIVEQRARQTVGM